MFSTMSVSPQADLFPMPDSHLQTPESSAKINFIPKSNFNLSLIYSTIFFSVNVKKKKLIGFGF